MKRRERPSWCPRLEDLKGRFGRSDARDLLGWALRRVGGYLQDLAGGASPLRRQSDAVLRAVTDLAFALDEQIEVERVHGNILTLEDVQLVLLRDKLRPIFADEAKAMKNNAGFQPEVRTRLHAFLELEIELDTVEAQLVTSHEHTGTPLQTTLDLIQALTTRGVNAQKLAKKHLKELAPTAERPTANSLYEQHRGDETDDYQLLKLVVTEVFGESEAVAEATANAYIEAVDKATPL